MKRMFIFTMMCLIGMVSLNAQTSGEETMSPVKWVTIINSTSFMRMWLHPGGSDSKESACNAGDPGSIPGSGRSPEEGNGNLLQLFLPREFHGQRSLGGLQSMGPQRVRHN